MSKEMDDVGTPKWQLVLCVFSVFLILYFALFKGVKSSAKISQQEEWWIHPSVQPVKTLCHSSEEAKKFLDEEIYTERKITLYQWMYEGPFLSTGGKKLAEEFITSLNLLPGQKVLDVGSGLGGHAIYMAKTCDVKVLGIDLSSYVHNAAQKSYEDMKSLAEQVHFKIADITTEEFENEIFDLIYSTETLAHIQDKEQLIQNFFRWLKPGGKLFFTDLIQCTDNPSENFQEFINTKHYHLLKKDDYKHILENTGFVDISLNDLSEKYKEITCEEYWKLGNEIKSFKQQFTDDDLKFLAKSWFYTVKRIHNGEQGWISSYARKPGNVCTDVLK